MKHTRFFLLSLFLAIVLFQVNAQNKTDLNVKSQKEISGLVIDSKGEPIIGANILIQGLNSGTVSDRDGKFNLMVPINAKLLVSYVGFTSVVISVAGESNLKIKLLEDGKILDEVVVVGYGSVRKSDLTGSVSKLANLNAAENDNTSVERLIQGKVSGVQITKNTGDVGGGYMFSVRGANSVTGSNQPLVVIDGYPVESGSTRVTLGADASFGSDMPGTNALSMLNPNDIASIEILKDASSTAIYGSRGANGVVLITTKRGQEGKDRIEYSFRLDVNSLQKKLDVLNTQEYLAYANEAYMDRNNGSYLYSKERIDQFKNINTNWQDLIFDTGISQEHQLMLSGGDKKLKYVLSIGYLDQHGIIQNSFFNRGTFRLNLDRSINDRLNFGVNISGNMSENKSVMQAGKSGDIGSSIISAALRTIPLYEPYTAEDQVNLDNQFTNPLTLVQSVDDRNKLTQVSLSLNVGYKITKDLQFKIKLGLNNTDALRNYYMPRGTYLGNVRNGYAYEGNSRSFNYLNENTLNYIKQISNVSRVNAVVGYTWQSWTSHIIGSGSAGFANDNLKYFNMYSASVVDKNNNSTQTWALGSYLGRIIYSYDNKYLATVTARADGSTKLASGHKWALFPSFALGWNVNNEDFMKDLIMISELKLRASWGVSGNQAIYPGATKSVYIPVSSVINETLLTSYVPGNMANDILGWENTEQYNFGLDLALLNGDIRFGYEYYNKKTDNLLINLPLPPTTGYTNYASNAGSVENRGMEFDISAKIFKRKFKWDVAGNISFNRNKILQLGSSLTQFAGDQFGQINSQSPNIAKEGFPIGAYYGYKVIGIFQTAQEVKNSPVDPSNPRPGDFKFADLNGDNKIDANDQTVIGSPYPDYIFGVTNDFSWKNFSLNVFVQGSIGQEVVNANNYFLSGLSMANTSNVSRQAFENRWTGPGTSNKYPAAQSLRLPFFGRFSDFLVEDASFVRLKSVTFAYTLPKSVIKNISKIKVFVSGSNLLTLTKYSGYDPEVNSRGDNSLTPGIDLGSIPQFRTVSAGFNIGF